jgi:UDP-N-acetylmuramoyl-tripeptide--D-alanyl-D-alanine ligase
MYDLLIWAGALKESEKTKMIRKDLQYYKATKLKAVYHLLIRMLAKYWLKLNRQAKIIAVVGSYGKTTTCQTIHKLLSQISPTIVSDINLDTIYNIPLTILRLRKKHKYLILEVGVDHKNEMDFHLKLFSPDLVVFTGITPVHSDKNLLGSLQGIVKEKEKIVDKLGKNKWLVANKDNKFVAKIAKRHGEKTIYYSLKNADSEVYANKIKFTTKKTSFVLNSQKKALKLSGSFVGNQFVAAIMAAAGIAVIEKTPVEKLVKLAKSIKPLKGRMSLEKGPSQTILINDSLRANPASTRAGLETVSSLKTKRKIAILGEMGELGEYKNQEHEKIGNLINSLDFDYVIAVGPLMKLASKKIEPQNTIVFSAKNVFEAADFLVNSIKPRKGDIIYLKGSLLKHMERVILIANGKKVGCKVVSCPFYNHCLSCKYLRSGYPVKF